MFRQIILATIALATVFASQGQQYGSFKDSRDERIYKTVKIGDQVWMAENLNVARFRNGDLIPEAKTAKEWEEAGNNKRPAWCYYNNDTANGKKYGRLYNSFAVNDSRRLAPEGWHIPTNAEWNVLTGYLGGLEKAGAKMKSKEGWSNGGNGTNSSGFSGLPRGNRNVHGTFGNVGSYGFWWSSSEDDADSAWFHSLFYLHGSVFRFISSKGEGLSVRCLRD
jgi:uncharacterized protein (TIGR02145 family)